MRLVLFMFISVFGLSASGQNNTLALKDEPIVADLFTAEELEQLQELVEIYDGIIQEEYPNLNLFDAYKKYFAVMSISGSETYAQVYEKALNDIDPSKNQVVKNWMNTLNESGMFHEIWITNEHVTFVNKKAGLVKKCFGISLLFQDSGKLFQLMELKAETDPKFMKYVTSIKRAQGDIGPSAVKQMLDMVSEGGLDLAIDSNRLMIALHYLTLGTNMNCNGKYK